MSSCSPARNTGGSPCCRVTRRERTMPEFQAERHFGAEVTQVVFEKMTAGTGSPLVAYVYSLCMVQASPPSSRSREASGGALAFFWRRSNGIQAKRHPPAPLIWDSESWNFELDRYKSRGLLFAIIKYRRNEVCVTPAV